MSSIKIFEDKKVRISWDADNEEWLFSIVDVVAILTESPRPRNYWSDLKRKLEREGSELHEKIVQLKMRSSDGKFYATDVLDTVGILRLVQSIPSPKAEPFKMWLAEVGNDRLNEIEDPEKAILRGADFYRKKGYPESWINQRLQTIEIRKELTDEWQKRGITKEKEYAILTDEMTRAWSGLSVKEYKGLKNIKKENLRDNMTNVELVLNMLAEVTTTNISVSKEPSSFEQSRRIAKEGGEVAGIARSEFEKRTGKKAVSAVSAKNKNMLEIREKNEDD